MMMVLDKIEREIKNLYVGLDAVAQRAVNDSSKKVNCTRGCYACCRIMVMTALAEGCRIATRVLDMPKERRLDVTLRMKATAAVDESVEDYAQKGHYCAFLDMETKDCTIYEVRPASCRYHYVVSPPGMCRPDISDELLQMDMLSLEEEVQYASHRLTGHLIAAPLPNMVLHCIRLIDPSKRKAAEGVMSPGDWVRMIVKHKKELLEMEKNIMEARETNKCRQTA